MLAKAEYGAAKPETVSFALQYAGFLVVSRVLFTTAYYSPRSAERYNSHGSL